jgi:hypothetical protein
MSEGWWKTLLKNDVGLRRRVVRRNERREQSQQHDDAKHKERYT